MNKHNRDPYNDYLQSKILDILLENQAGLTVWQIYSALTAHGIVPMTESGYRQMCYQLQVMQERGLIPNGWLGDPIKQSLGLAMARIQTSYHPVLRTKQRDRVEGDDPAGAGALVIPEYPAGVDASKSDDCNSGCKMPRDSVADKCVSGQIAEKTSPAPASTPENCLGTTSCDESTE